MPRYVCVGDSGAFIHVLPSLPTPHWVGWIHLNKVWGNTSGGWGAVLMVGKRLIG